MIWIIILGVWGCCVQINLLLLDSMYFHSNQFCGNFSLGGPPILDRVNLQIAKEDRPLFRRGIPIPFLGKSKDISPDEIGLLFNAN